MTWVDGDGSPTALGEGSGQAGFVLLTKGVVAGGVFGVGHVGEAAAFFCPVVGPGIGVTAPQDLRLARWATFATVDGAAAQVGSCTSCRSGV
ncbi:hypothetical protein [Streptomyces sp. NPDC005385]|uniref:hypothetical protein n=1 Tax=Streptomyces sp. NPDC005385 TaxID=3157039 RepID=UPI0033B8BF0F